MNQVFDFFFSQYSDYSSADTLLEINAVIFGFMSVWYSKHNNIWCSIGTHPHNAEEESHISAEEIIKLCKNKKVI